MSYAEPIAPNAVYRYSGGLPASLTGTARIYNDTGRTLTINSVRASLDTAGSTTTTVDVKLSGTTIFTTTANRPALTSAAVSVKSARPDVAAWPDGGYLTVDIVAGGTGAVGLQVQINAS